MVEISVTFFKGTNESLGKKVRIVCLVSLSSELFRRGSDMSNAPVFSLTFPLPAFWNISRVFYPINYTWTCLAVTYILLIYCLLHTTYIHYLYVAQFPSDCKRKKEENKMSKKVSACKGRGNLRTFQDFYSRLKEVSIWKCYWSIVRWILRNKATFKQKAQENV